MRRSPRVVSLVPSLTETLVAWQVEPVACTRFCEQPALRHVGGTKDPDLASIVELAPDLVVMDAEENRREDHDELTALGLAVHAVRIRSVQDLDEQLPSLAEHVGATWQPLDLADLPPPTRSAVVPIWKRPWMFLGEPTYGSSLLAAVGVSNALADRGPYPELDLTATADARPDLVIAPDEPYPFAERHREVLEQVAPAVFVDGRDLLWWGERTRAALDRFRRAAWPSAPRTPRR
jgi:ABC-type Fe3+-hydroxamate transport system substrate-binding protein